MEGREGIRCRAESCLSDNYFWCDILTFSKFSTSNSDICPVTKKKWEVVVYMSLMLATMNGNYDPSNPLLCQHSLDYFTLSSPTSNIRPHITSHLFPPPTSTFWWKKRRPTFRSWYISVSFIMERSRTSQEATWDPQCRNEVCADKIHQKETNISRWSSARH